MNNTGLHATTTKEELKWLAGQCFMPAAFINDSEEAIRNMEHLIRDYNIGGLCFFHSPASAATNFEGKKEVIYNAQSREVLQNLIERYQEIAPTPLLISIDAEWGLAMRVENTPQFPYALTLGAIKENNQLIEEVAYHIGSDCRNLGIHWNFAPVVDCNTNPSNPVIGYRSFGANKKSVAAKGMAFAAGLKKAGIMNCIKHFPGHGDTATDSHLGLPVINKTIAALESEEFYPFKKIIDNGIDAVMVGHLAVPAIEPDPSKPSTLSKQIITQLLKKEWGYEGMVVTDALNMHAVTKVHTQQGQVEYQAFLAGNDILCFPNCVEEALDLILENISESEIRKRVERVKTFKSLAFKRAPVSLRGSRSRDQLFAALALNSLSWYKGNRDLLGKVRKQHFMGITIGRSDSAFHQAIRTEYNYPLLDPDQQGLDDVIGQARNFTYTLMAIYPPQLRPRNSFGFPEATLELVRVLASATKLIVYHFGNPYALKLWEIDTFEAVVIAYQDFPEFQYNAAEHFLGKNKAKGSLPVQLIARNHD